MGSVDVTVRVIPGAPWVRVGGNRAGRLVVRVTARAVEGAANRAVLAAVAAAWGVRPGAVLLVGGRRARDKVVRIDGETDLIRARWDQLLELAPP